MQRSISLRQIAVIISECCLIGRLKPPGTLGSLIAIPWVCLTYTIGGSNGLYILAILSFLIGIVAVHVYQIHYGIHDYPQIIIDEFCGMIVTFIILPPDIIGSPMNVLLSFCLFRLFDIIKPYPINIIDKQISGALGVITDDIIAGVYAGLIGSIIST